MNSEFWIDFAPATEHLSIGTFSLGDPNHVDMVNIWLRPYRYDTSHFEFGWRKDLEHFFDSFQANIKKIDERTDESAVDAAYSKHRESKASIFNGLKDDEPVKITAFREDNLMNYLEEEEAVSYEEYLTNPPKPSIFNGLKEDDDDEDEYI